MVPVNQPEIGLDSFKLPSKGGEMCRGISACSHMMRKDAEALFDAIGCLLTPNVVEDTRAIQCGVAWSISFKVSISGGGGLWTSLM